MLPFYTIGHFFVDFACAYIVLKYGRNGANWYTVLLIYNCFAFAVQMPLGLLADLLGRGKIFALSGFMLVLAAIGLRDFSIGLCIAAGLGNALYHVGGGYDVLNKNDSTSQLGIFVSMGALGLFIGSIASRSAFPAWAVSCILVLCALGVIVFCPCIDRNYSVRVDVGLKDGIHLFCLFLVVILRSYNGFLFHFSWKKGILSWIFIICIVLGKALGGMLYDFWGGRMTVICSLGLASLLFLFSDYPFAGCSAVLFFNMTMPVTLRKAADLLPRAKGFSFGLLTFALYIGLLPVALGLPEPPFPAAYIVICLISLFMLVIFDVKKSL